MWAVYQILLVENHYNQALGAVLNYSSVIHLQVEPSAITELPINTDGLAGLEEAVL